MDVYIDDMLVKSVKAGLHITHLAEAFQILKSYNMKLNLAKCAFGVSVGKFLGFIVNSRGIEANQDKIKVVLDMLPPSNIKDIQRLTRRIAALSRFVSKARDKCQPFFQVLKKAFQWDAHCKEAFMALKTYLSSPLFLVSPYEGELLTLYLVVSDFSTSVALRAGQSATSNLLLQSSSERSRGEVSKDGETNPRVGNIQKTPTILPSSYHRSPNRISD